MDISDLFLNLLIFLGGFLVIFIITYVIYFKKLSSKKRKNKSITEITYLVHKFNLDEKALPKKKMILWISMQNAFIISFVWVFISSLRIKIMWQLLIAFVMILALIYALYEIYGRHLVKKGYQKVKGRSKNEY